MSNITRIDSSTAGLPATLQPSVEKARGFIKESIPENTQRAYANDWAIFEEWCEKKRVAALPAHPATIAGFLADEASRCRPSTLRRRLAALGRRHSVAGHPNPCLTDVVRSTMKGIEHRFGLSQESKAPATHTKVELMISACPTMTLDGLRARALILLGYAGAFRRSELVALDCTDLKWSKEGVLVTVRRSKTDQRGKTITKAIPFVEGGGLCAATALRAWLTASGIDSGPVFRGFTRNGKPKPRALSGHAVALIVKECAERCGLEAEDFSGHSLRAGHVTEARSRGVADSQTMATTGHRRVETLDVYDRRENAFERTSAGQVLTARTAQHVRK